jgi:FAD/FMN-containing dehydrogenase
MPQTLNDVHSQLNATEVARIERPRSLAALQAVISEARSSGKAISVAGGRHAMGGQQFAAGSLHIDTSALDAVLSTDPVKGRLHIEAGAHWPRIIEASHGMAAPDGGAWGIRQKQTGVDAVSLGGSISANAHGRGLLMPPLGDDIENLTLINAQAEVVFCSRERNAELFSLVIGGYGLFGVIYSATLRLSPRQRVRRVVDIIDLDDAMNAVLRRVDEGCRFGDFQFAIDAGDDGFLRRGVLACYKPVPRDEPPQATAADLPAETWLQLLKLAHDDKRAAFRLYAQHYLGTDGNCYWSDTMQLSTYLPSYAEYLERARSDEAAATGTAAPKETLVIGEHSVPRPQLMAFMQRARALLRAHGSEVIYGTIRSILRDTVSFLPWAKDDFACVVFNLRTPHSAVGIERTAATFRALADAGIALGGSFFLTYHRYATAAQVQAAFPRFREFLQRKRVHDPQELFTSNWYRHYRDAFARAAAQAR